MQMARIKQGFYCVQVGIGNKITEVFDFSTLVFLFSIYLDKIVNFRSEFLVGWYYGNHLLEPFPLSFPGLVFYLLKVPTETFSIPAS